MLRIEYDNAIVTIVGPEKGERVTLISDEFTIRDNNIYLVLDPVQWKLLYDTINKKDPFVAS